MQAPNSPRGKKSWRRRLRIGAWILAAFVALACLTRLALFRGPYLPLSPLPERPLVDLHCHIAGLGHANSGCFVSPALRDNWRFSFYLRSFGVTRTELAESGDGLMVQRLSGLLAQSRHVDRAVILAIDGVVNDQGELDRERTEFYVPNEFVAEACRQHTNLLFGASINPHRSDALARLDWVANQGAVLVKWLPPIQRIDPGDARFEPFYRRMAALGMPLLTHTGKEGSFTQSAEEYGDPERLRLPLALGVTVIAAHVATPGEHEGERDLDRLARLMTQHTNLFADISSLTQLNKVGWLGEVLERREFRGRLLYATDFPLINMALVSPWYFPLNLELGEMRRISRLENPWDRDVELKHALGVPTEVFAEAARRLRSVEQPRP